MSSASHVAANLGGPGGILRYDSSTSAPSSSQRPSVSAGSTNMMEFKSTLSPLASSATHVARSFVESPDKDDDGDIDATRPASQAIYRSETLPNLSRSKNIKSQSVAPLLTSTIDQRLYRRFQRRTKRFLQKATVLLTSAQYRLKKNQFTSILPISLSSGDSPSLPLESSCSLRGGDDLSHPSKDQQLPQRPPNRAKSTIKKSKDEDKDKDKDKDNPDKSTSNGYRDKETSGSNRNSQEYSRLSSGYITADPESIKKNLGPFIQSPTSPQERFFADPSPFPALFPHRARSEDLMFLSDGFSSLGLTNTSTVRQLRSTHSSNFGQTQQGSTGTGEGSCNKRLPCDEEDIIKDKQSSSGVERLSDKTVSYDPQYPPENARNAQPKHTL
jgi:hypothetical protein